MSVLRSTLIFLLFLLTSLSLNACGNKGPLQPLDLRQPGQPQAARLLQRGSDFQLQWKLPKKAQDATSAADIDFVEIERLISTADAYCPSCPDPWPRIARISPYLPQPARQVRDIFLLRDSGGRPGEILYYRLRVRNLSGTYSPPLLLQQTYRLPLPAPGNLQAEEQGHTILLSWNPSEVPEDATLLGYQVYRRRDEQPFSPLPTNRRPLKTTSFSDYDLASGHTYSYRVRSLFDFSGEQVESRPGRELSFSPLQPIAK